LIPLGAEESYGVDLLNYLKLLVSLDTRVFKKAEDIPMVDEVGWKLVELVGVLGRKEVKAWREQQGD